MLKETLRCHAMAELSKADMGGIWNICISHMYLKYKIRILYLYLDTQKREVFCIIFFILCLNVFCILNVLLTSKSFFLILW